MLRLLESRSSRHYRGFAPRSAYLGVGRPGKLGVRHQSCALERRKELCGWDTVRKPTVRPHRLPEPFREAHEQIGIIIPVPVVSAEINYMKRNPARSERPAGEVGEVGNAAHMLAHRMGADNVEAPDETHIFDRARLDADAGVVDRGDQHSLGKQGIPFDGLLTRVVAGEAVDGGVGSRAHSEKRQSCDEIVAGSNLQHRFTDQAKVLDRLDKGSEQPVQARFVGGPGRSAPQQARVFYRRHPHRRILRDIGKDLGGKHSGNLRRTELAVKRRWLERIVKE